MITDAILYNEELAEQCIYGADFVKDLLCIDGHTNIYVPEKNYPMSYKRIEGFKRICKYRNYYQQNPVRFIKDFFNIQLLDSQAYLMMSVWKVREGMILASRSYGKSFWVVLFCMAKQMLASSPWNCYIASGSAEQSATTFKKLEDIANDRIGSLMNSSGVIFKNEVEVNNAVGDGFSHSPAGFEYHLFNGSMTKSLNSNISRNRGKRAACVIYDECSFLSEELISVYAAFCALDKDFKTGVNDDGTSFDNAYLHTIPKDLPNQLIYVSSASSTDTEFYRKYRDLSKRMIAGDPDVFVADIDCELVMKPTIAGNKVKSVLTREMIESQVATNPIKARREFFNEFQEDAGADAIVKRGVITRNEETRKPALYNETGDKKYIIAFDPARQYDNSFVLISEVCEYRDASGKPDKRIKIVNGVNLIDISKKNKTPMDTPRQIEYLKKIILDYNAGADGYGNIIGIFIDSGAGGNGRGISDFLKISWKSKDGTTHKGLIDKKSEPEDAKKFPDAVDKIRLIEPAKYKSIMFEELIELLNQDKISFTSSYDNKGYLTVFDVDQEEYQKAKERISKNLRKKNLSKEEFEEELNKKLENENYIKTKTVKLDHEEELALANIDAMKEELVNIVRKERESGKDSFDLTPEKANKMHDDRAYCMALTAHALAELRRKDRLNVPKPSTDNLMDQLIIRPAKYK